MALADSRGFHTAGRRLHRQLECSLRELRQTIDTVLSETTTVPSFVPSLGDLLEEIRSLPNEFDVAKFDFEKNTLSVTTDPIILEGVELGPFEIKLSWDRLDEPCPYEVIAREPLFAAPNENVCHPHVEADRLCEGDGRTAIRQALKDGRLGDFFAIVNRILNTYNSGSAYVALDQWNGQSCADCDTLISDEYAYVCESCHTTICAECDVGCNSCGDTSCVVCNRSCVGCDFGFCSYCLKSCTDCDASFCADCLIKERCPACHEKQNDECSDESESPRTEKAVDPPHVATPTPEATTERQAVTAIQPNGLGQTAVSA